MPTLADYRDPVLDKLAAIRRGVVDVDPDLADLEAHVSVISGSLFDREKLADAYSGHYVWVPKYGDNRRVEDQGYRVRYISVFEPPASGVYRLQFYGRGETGSISASASAVAIRQAILATHADLDGTEVDVTSDNKVVIHLPERQIGMGATAGRLLSQSGVGVLITQRGFSLPLKRGTTFITSGLIPFENEDETTGLHTCINDALAEVRIPDLLPVWGDLPYPDRSRVLSLRSIVPWLTPQDIIGFFSPTDWQMAAVFHPPAAGSYTLTLSGWRDIGPTPVSLAYNASGLEIETALRLLVGDGYVQVSPLGVASAYTILWRTQFHDGMVRPSAGWIRQTINTRLHEPYPTMLPPTTQSDAEYGTLTDPGYPEGQTWFVYVRRRGHTRIAPETYPRKADGSLDTSQDPIPGEIWQESLVGLRGDQDQAVPQVAQVTDLALQYVYEAIASASPRGESAEWEAKAHRQAARAAGPLVYGPQSRRGQRGHGPVPVGWQYRGRSWWLPD